MKPRGLRTGKEGGITLIELMVVVAIVGILAAIAYPSYQNHVTNSWRAQAASCLHELAQGMERRFTANMSYIDPDIAIGDLPPNSCVADIQAATRYQFSFTANPTPNAFVLRAVPQGTQAANETRCGTMTINQAGVKTVTGTAAADVRRCL